jgi:fatty-acyl-CoA synthase/long-chain acyl-CoA synthetase
MQTNAEDRLVTTARANPDKIAIIDDVPGAIPLIWTYAELDEWASRLACALVKIGLDIGTPIAWYGPNSGYLVGIIHALRLGGFTTVPINYRLTPPEAAYVINDSGAQAIFVDEAMRENFEALRNQVPKVTRRMIYSPDRPWKPGVSGTSHEGDDFLDTNMLSDSADSLERSDRFSSAMVMTYTSGTTGRPKGAQRPETASPSRALDAAALGREIGYNANDIYMTTGPMYHSGPGGFMRMAHRYGQTVVVQRHFDPVDWLRLLDTWKVSSTFSAPTPIRLVCGLSEEEKVKFDRSSMRIMIANAAPWPLSLKRQYLADFPPESLWEVYGSTELGVTTLLKPGDQLRKPGSCGLPAPGIELKLVDAAGDAIEEPGVPGEIYVRGTSVFLGYHEEAGSESSDGSDQFKSVGDIAYRDEEGYLFVCDRKIDMIISGGMNIYSIEVELALATHPEVREVAVYGLPNEKWGESVHADIVAEPKSYLASSDQAAIDDLIEHARSSLAGYKVPRSVRFLGELPKTESGKVLKRTLRSEYLQQSDSVA